MRSTNKTEKATQYVGQKYYSTCTNTNNLIKNTKTSFKTPV